MFGGTFQTREGFLLKLKKYGLKPTKHTGLSDPLPLMNTGAAAGRPKSGLKFWRATDRLLAKKRTKILSCL